MDSLVTIRRLTYGYRGHEDVQVLQGIDLDIEKSEFLAIAGRTGSGKSTLCYALNGLVPHSFGGRMEGDVVVAGINTRESTPAQLARKVGIVLQSAESQIVGLTVEEDTEFGLENIALPVSEIKERARWALEVVQMTAYLHVSPWNLSGGQKQRLAIASALAFRPELLVLDNPTAELDPIGKEEVLETIARLNQDHYITIVIVDQDLHEVIPYAHRLAILDRGQILLIDTPARVLDQAQTVRDAGVKLPDVTEIGYQMRKSNRWSGQLPVTVSEARRSICEIIPPGASLGSLRMPEPQKPGETLIQIEQLSFHYQSDRPVLKEIDLRIQGGEFIALMGHNGAGKTTLAKHLNGLLKPVSGRVLVEGMDTREKSVAELAARIGYVFQNPDHQIFSKTVGEELAFGPKNLGWSAERIRASIQHALADIHMEEKVNAEPYFMGLAERKLIAIASVLVMEPEVLVLDEPATGADYGVALQIMRYISDLHQRGLTVVIITHDVSLAANYATRLILMQAGRVVLDGTPREVFMQKEFLRECHIALPQVAELGEGLCENLPGLNVIRVQEMVDILRGV